MRSILFFVILLSTKLFAQVQTMGLYFNNENSFNGYTLIAPTSNKNTYLIDNCGNQVHKWESDFSAGLVAYLLEDGDLLRTRRYGSGTFNGGGIGGGVEKLDWNGDVVWEFEYHQDSAYHQHHDVEYLPNGNVLMIAWEWKNGEDAIENGRRPDLIPSKNEIWPDHIIEVKPFGTSGGEIVWEWHLWDHLVQDYDETKLNYGVVSEHPELLNINFDRDIDSPNNISADWIHANAVAYNEKLDQIAISCKHLREIWIIDHSTTTEEAASHSGGNSGKGGDFLYRWGNPRAYDRGTISDQQLFDQHDIHWIPDSLKDGGKLMVYNNGTFRPGGNTSTVDIINPPINSLGLYDIQANTAFGPTSFDWTYADTQNPETFFSKTVSGAQRLPNDNTLICEGASGELIEVDYEGNVVWKYTSPIKFAGPATQGSQINGNGLFRAYRYPTKYNGLKDKELVPVGPIELEPLPSSCEIVDSIDDVETQIHILHYPTVVTYNFVVDVLDNENLQLEIIDVKGNLVQTNNLSKNKNSINIYSLSNGVYFCKVINKSNSTFEPFKIIKQ